MSRTCRSILWLLAALFGMLCLTGCESDKASNNAQTQVPWSRPTQWEGGLPGMMGAGGMGR